MSKSNCPYCGPSPIPHFPNWIESSFSVLLSPFDDLILGSFISSFITKIFRPLWLPFIKLLVKTKIASLNPDFQKIDNPRVKVLYEEAKKRNIDMQSINLLGKPIDYYLAKIGGQTIIFNGIPRPPKTGKTGLWWMDDKKILKSKLSKVSIPVPRGESFSKLKPLLDYFRGINKPVVVKPRLGSRGRHTSTHVYTEKDLIKAFKIAKQLCYWVVIEEHLDGSVYRGTVVDGKLIGVLGGSPPKITGNGKSTIRELIEKKNESKPQGVKDFKPSPSTLEFLSRLGYALGSILENGKVIDLTEKIGVNYGGLSFEVTPETHPGFKTYLEKAAQVVGDPILGFDFIAENIKKSPDSQKWGIIEANSLPFINLHHDPLIGKPINAAGFVWDLWKK